MGAFLDEVCDQLNLRWAWDKVCREATPGDIWFDEVELAGFDLELESNLRSIAVEFRTGQYRMMRLRPLPFPKHPARDGTARVRQAFQIAIRDQVAWTAIVNVVGPHVDGTMPPWSYGNRLFRSIWVEEKEDGKRFRRIGNYRNSTGRIYLAFAQSYPVFRRHVYLTTRAMLTDETSLPDVDERTQEEAELQESLAAEDRCPFVVREYWNSRRPEAGPTELYWCSVDLEKFYPSVHLSVVRDNILSQLPHDWRSEAGTLLDSMLDFRIDSREWTSPELAAMGLAPRRTKFHHIPTGLYVAGFLANAALLRVDAQVFERLRSKSVAHFRFVDDHIVLAYSLADLLGWINEYIALLNEAETGTRVNPEKVEPPELQSLIAAMQQNEAGPVVAALREKALSACRLDPEFPSPLMTKPLNLVSGIARIDFNLLESAELGALTDQLEHLLLVDLSEKEMQVKTRLSFAATRLTRVVECRLANDDIKGALACRREVLRAELASRENDEDAGKRIAKELAQLDEEIEGAEKEIERAVNRAFQLIRKVLRERPDRIRLWTRAVLMCRLTGARGLADLRDDIVRIRGIHSLAVEYLRANLLMIVGSQAIVAAHVAVDENAPPWRREAAWSFLKDVRATDFDSPDATSRSFLRTSWALYCYGVYCADLILRASGPPIQIVGDHFFPPSRLAAAARYGDEGAAGHGPAQWAWWAAKPTLRDLNSHASPLAQALGKTLSDSNETYAFWRFFPLDIPGHILDAMLRLNRGGKRPRITDGWLFDALRTKQNSLANDPGRNSVGQIGRVWRVLRNADSESISLHEWCDFIRQVAATGSSDPRTGEWTALAVVRQIAALVDGDTTLNLAYLKAVAGKSDAPICLHPANFRIPRKWASEPEPTWLKWKDTIQSQANADRVTQLRARDRVVDHRYSPLDTENRLFHSVNPVRGLGLLLYGLLRKDLDLPTLWNGPGHADVLGMIFPVLLADMTCSSWTLGVLQGCLQPRVTENLILQMMMAQFPNASWLAPTDSAHDPKAFFNAMEVAIALEQCQRVLEDCQLSTLGHRARQLTPINIKQLTQPDWSRTFSNPEVDGAGPGE